MTAQLLLENLLTHPKGFGLRTATPLQRAICRASDGVDLGDLWDLKVIREAFGNAKPPSVAPKILCVVAAIRSAKTLISAAKAVQVSQTVQVDVPWIGAGDEIRVPILSIAKDQARAAYSHVLGNVYARPLLERLLVDKPTAETIKLRHPSGRKIEIQISAMSRAGSTLIARWLASAIFDEAPRMPGSDEGARALDDAMTAVAGRILPGGQIMLIGSPRLPFGPVYRLVSEHFGRPSDHCVVVRAAGPDMNPVYWTQDRIDYLKNTDQKAYQTDVLGQFQDPDDALFSVSEIDAVTGDLPTGLANYSAALDTSRAARWAMVVVGSVKQDRYFVAEAKHVSGVDEACRLCEKYRVENVWTDHHVPALVCQQFSDRDVNLVEHGQASTQATFGAECMLRMVENVRELIRAKALILPRNELLRDDLIQTRKRVSTTGVVLELPRNGEARHCDFSPVLAMALAYPPDAPETEKQSDDPYLEAAIQAVEDRKPANRLGWL